MHAYLILAHNNFGVLKKLIQMLDNESNDLYIHIDKSVKDFDFEYYKSIASKSCVYFTDRVNISWGDYSMVKAEYLLLKKAYENQKKYKYYHLISGVDLPLKTADELHAFFDAQYPKEFIHFAKSMNNIELSRVKHYHFFTGRRNIFNRLMTKAEQIFQTILGINRVKKTKVARGSQWFSISDDFVRYLLDNEKQIKKRLRFTFIPDEFFVQLAAVNSRFADNLYCDRFDNSSEQNMRLIDWTRGHPYTFNEEDFDEIMNSGCMFVRKLTDDNKLPDMIFERISK